VPCDPHGTMLPGPYLRAPLFVRATPSNPDLSQTLSDHALGRRDGWEMSGDGDGGWGGGRGGRERAWQRRPGSSRASAPLRRQCDAAIFHFFDMTRRPGNDATSCIVTLRITARYRARIGRREEGRERENGSNRSNLSRESTQSVNFKEKFSVIVISRANDCSLHSISLVA